MCACVRACMCACTRVCITLYNTTKTRKCTADFIGPLVISKVLDSTHYILSNLQGHILIGVYHIKRLKPAKVRTPTGIVSTYSQLRDAFQRITLEEADRSTFLQSVYDYPIQHHCSADNSCTCIEDILPLS